MRFDYLSDEELSKLISDVEQNDMVMAPPDMLGSILAQIDVKMSEGEKSNITVLADRKASKDAIVDFNHYRARVIASVAAVVAAVMIVPEIAGAIPQDISVVEDGRGRSSVVGQEWSETIGNSHIISDFINR